MSLADKYGIPEEKIKMLIRDGYISCSVPKCEEVIYHYKRKIQDGIPKPEAVLQTAAEKNISKSYMYRLLKEFE